MTIVIKVFARQNGQITAARGTLSLDPSIQAITGLIGEHLLAPRDSLETDKASGPAKDYIIIREEFLVSNATEIGEKPSGSIHWIGKQ